MPGDIGKGCPLSPSGFTGQHVKNSGLVIGLAAVLAHTGCCRCSPLKHALWGLPIPRDVRASGGTGHHAKHRTLAFGLHSEDRFGCVRDGACWRMGARRNEECRKQGCGNSPEILKDEHVSPYLKLIKKTWRLKGRFS